MRSRVAGRAQSPPAAGHDAAFEEVFRGSYGRLVRSLSRISPDAADAVQEAFVEAHLRWESIVTYEDPVGWVRRVAVNRLIDADRRRVRQARLAERLRQLVRPAVAADATASDGRPLEVHEALLLLPLRQRLAVSLFYLDDLSVEQVAAAMAASPGTVKAALHHGRKNLRRLLEVPE